MAGSFSLFGLGEWGGFVWSIVGCTFVNISVIVNGEVGRFKV